MRGAFAYAVLALAVVAIPTAAVGAGTDGRTAAGVAVAAGVAYPVMVGSFALMVRFRRGGNGFLAAWAAGMLARLAALAFTTWLVVRSETLDPAPTLLGLAGFFFVLLLLEPVFFRERGPREDRRAPPERMDVRDSTART